VSEFSQRLRLARMARGMTQQTLAAQLNISRGTLANWETGRTTPDPETIHRLAVLLETSADVLLGVRSPVRRLSPDDSALGGKNVSIPVVGSVEVASFGLKYADEHGYESADKREINDDGANHFYLVVQSDSMIGDGILPGDLLLVHEQPKIGYGQVAVVAVDSGKGVVKRVFQKDGSLILQSSNPAYPPLIFSGQEIKRVKIIGRVKVVKRQL